MLDGKVINSLTDTLSTQSCNVSGAKPSEMNKLDVIRGKNVNMFTHSDNVKETTSCQYTSFP